MCALLFYKNTKIKVLKNTINYDVTFALGIGYKNRGALNNFFLSSNMSFSNIHSAYI